jgi:N,N'-diacetyllegionaminate synthase
MIIAEIGQNHCGNMDYARWLIELARDNGASFAKFQLFDSKKLYGDTEHHELSKAQAFELFEYGKKVGIEVFFSVFDVERVRWCEEMGVGMYKVAHSKRNDKGLRDAIDKTGKTCLVSGKNIYCIPKYPTSLELLNFVKINFRDWWGFSDHTIGLDAAKIALARGAWIIEKHFALTHDMGVDAPWSMTALELNELARFEEIVKECL